MSFPARRHPSINRMGPVTPCAALPDPTASDPIVKSRGPDVIRPRRHAVGSFYERRWRSNGNARIVMSAASSEKNQTQENTCRSEQSNHSFSPSLAWTQHGQSGLRSGFYERMRWMTAADFRRIALSLEGAEEGSHMGHADFRVGGRIFATLAHVEKGYGNLMLTPEMQAAFVEERPQLYVPVAGRMGKKRRNPRCFGEGETGFVGRRFAGSLENTGRQKSKKRSVKTNPNK